MMVVSENDSQIPNVDKLFDLMFNTALAKAEVGEKGTNKLLTNLLEMGSFTLAGFFGVLKSNWVLGSRWYHTPKQRFFGILAYLQ